MSSNIIGDRLKAYNCDSIQEEEHALKEISQELILLALSRTDFFSLAAFHGGTALRILYGLNRFSEDLDFTLLKPNLNFDLTPYLNAVKRELKAYGYNMEIDDRSSLESNVRKAFLKDDSLGRLLNLNFASEFGRGKKIKIKFEVDVNPPAGAKTELKYLSFPEVFSIQALDLPSSFAGKSHALLCRQYVKGRDWYDFVWYVSRGVGINFSYIKSALHQVGPYKGESILVDKAWYLKQIRNKISSLDWSRVIADVKNFLRPSEQRELKHWSAQMFLDLSEKLERTI